MTRDGLTDTAHAEWGVVLFSGYPYDLHDLTLGLDNPDVAGMEMFLEWKDVEPREGEFDWSEVDRVLGLWGARGKFVDLRIVTANSDFGVTPQWVFEKYGVRRIAKGHFADFECGMDGFSLLNGAERTREGAMAVGGSWSVHFGTKAGAPSVAGLVSRPGVVLDADAVYRVDFDFRATADGTFWLRAVSAEGGAAAAIRHAWTAKAGDERGLSFELRLGPFNDYALEWGTAGPGTASVTRIGVHKVCTFSLLPEVDDGAWRLCGAGESAAHTGCGWTGRNSGTDYTPFLESDPGRFRIAPHTSLRVEFDYEVLEPGQFVLRATDGGSPPDHAAGAHFWHGARGARGTKVLRVHTGAASESWLQWGCAGGGALTVRRVRVTAWPDRTTEFPNYMDPRFREAWAVFVAHFAARYAGRHALRAVSIGAVGRWDEVMLDGDEFGVLDRQWTSHGYTDARFFEHIAWSMDLYRSHFPAKRVQVQTAYGLKTTGDSSLTYRRVAEMAASRGISLKQNGMTERYDTWPEPADPSWAFCRHRYDPRQVLVHESAGQMYNNYLGFMGHPVSYFGRAMMNGADIHYLYAPDLITRNVEKVFHWAAEQGGRCLATSLFCRLGAFPMRNDVTADETEYFDQWQGLRHVHLPPLNRAVWECVDGEHCASTCDNGRLHFDVDDRARYHGLHGAVFGIEYLDEGRGSFQVSLYDENETRWERIGTVERSDTGQWRTWNCYLGGRLNLARNDGIDPYHDIAVEDCGGPLVRVRHAEILAVPAGEWAREIALERPPTDAHRLLGTRIAAEIEVPHDAIPCAFAIPVWTDGSFARNGLWGRVLRREDGDWRLVSEKQYCFAGDGEWFELPVAGIRGGSFRVELTEPTGAVGWYEDSDGSPAVRVWRYRLALPPPSSAAPQPAGPLEPAVMTAGRLLALDQPVCGIWVGVSGDGLVRITVERSLYGGAWVSVACEDASLDPQGGWLSVPFEPQPAGTLRVSIALLEGTAEARVDGGGRMALEPMTLSRREAVRPPRAKPAGVPLVAWMAPHLTGEEGFQVGLSLKVTGAGDDVTSFAINGLHPSLTSPPELGIVARPTQCVTIRMKNASASSLARLWWTAPGQDLTPACSAFFPLVPNDSELRDYSCAVGLEPGWVGEIDGIHIEFACGITDRGRLEIAEIAVTDRTILANWSFDDEKDAFVAVRGVRSLDTGNGRMRVSVDCGPVVLQSQRWNPVLDAAPDQVIRIALRNGTEASQARLAWRRKGGAFVKGTAFDIVPCDSAMRTVTIPAAGLGEWTGTIVQLELSLPGQLSGDGVFEVGAITVEQPPGDLACISMPESEGTAAT